MSDLRHAIRVLANRPGFSVLATRMLRSFLFDVTPLDPLSIGVAVLTLAAVAAAGAWIPARRATKVDPLVALRTP